MFQIGYRRWLIADLDQSISHSFRQTVATELESHASKGKLTASVLGNSNSNAPNPPFARPCVGTSNCSLRGWCHEEGYMRHALNAFFWLVVCISLLLLASPSTADDWNRATTAIFNQPVQIPGKVLPPGIYVFKLAEF